VSRRPDDLGGLIADAQQGDQRAFDAIYARFADALFRYLYARTGDQMQAEDLLGELWVRVVERLPSFRLPAGALDAERAFGAWLYRIAYHLAVDSSRRARRVGEPLDEQIDSGEAPPESGLIAADERDALRAALERLTADQREVVLLRFYEERSSAEVAELTGRSVGAVKVLQHRALGSLARLLKGDRGL
jgi:RNA polymerase sigma-70 factor (ECF subfamily)